MIEPNKRLSTYMIKILIGVAGAVIVVLLIGMVLQTNDTDTEMATTTVPVAASNTTPVVPVTVGATGTLESTVSANNTLDLSGQSLTRTPAYVFNVETLEQLDLSNNSLEGSLQAEVRMLKNLKVLDLSNNKFTGVPAEIGQLKNLEVLDLSNNNITGLPSELANLSNLKLLNLQGNDYAEADLAGIKAKLPSTVEIRVD